LGLIGKIHCLIERRFEFRGCQHGSNAKRLS
jgi:hypothetical protein